jgi:hypothetical protein
MTLDIKALVDAMLGAMKPILQKSWKDVSEYATVESQKMAHTLASIAELRLAGKIDDEQAATLLEMQKHAMRAVLLAVEGVGLVAAQNAINAALDALKDTVNGAIGFQLL